jgi:hypothetical protein
MVGRPAPGNEPSVRLCLKVSWSYSCLPGEANLCREAGKETPPRERKFFSSRYFSIAIIFLKKKKKSVIFFYSRRIIVQHIQETG